MGYSTSVNVIALKNIKDKKAFFEQLTSSGIEYNTYSIQSDDLLKMINEKTKTNTPFIVMKSISNENKNEKLSHRENEVLSEIALGKGYKQISDTLCISINTVKFHMKNIYNKFNIHSHSEAALLALRKGLI